MHRRKKAREYATIRNLALTCRWLVFGVVLTLGCDNERAIAVAPTGHMRGHLDYDMPPVSQETASAMKTQFKEGPRPFEVIECANTYEVGQEVPNPSKPSMWLRFKNKIESVASVSEDQMWITETWTLDFVGNRGTRLVCVDQTITKPLAGDAWSVFVYPRGLIRHERWLRVEPENDVYFQPWERRELQALREAPWSKPKIRRLLELNATDFDMDHLEGAFEWAREQGDDDLAYEVLRHHTPVAQCSQDDLPLQAYRTRLKFCATTLRLECMVGALRLQTGSEYPQPARNFISKLPEGVDRINYAAGMVMHFPETPGTAQFSERAVIQEPEFMEPYLARLDELGRDPETDPYNRHLIAIEIGTRIADSLQTPQEIEAREELASRPWVPVSTAGQLRVMPTLANYGAQYLY